MLSNYLILCHPLLLFFFSLFKHWGFFQWIGSSRQVVKVWALQLQSFQWIFRMISFRMDWFDLLALQGTLKSLLQHHNFKVSILWHLAFLVQLSHPYMTTGKTIALAIWTFTGKATSLLFDMLSRFGIAFLPRSKRLLISWLQSSSAVILKPKKIKSVAAFTFPLLFVMSGGTRCHDLSFLNAEF